MLQPASEYGLSSAESAKPLVFFFKKVPLLSLKQNFSEHKKTFHFQRSRLFS